jgi:uncharacterized membrane protein YqhA
MMRRHRRCLGPMPVTARLMPATVAEPDDEPDQDQVPPDHGEPDLMPTRWPGSGFERSLMLSRSLALIPVVVLTLAGAGAFVYGAALFVHSAAEIIVHPFPVGNKIGLFLLVVDLFLVGATMLIAAIGFYELFISRISAGRQHDLPDWLVMHDLDELKARVVSMLVLVAAASFVNVVVDFHGAATTSSSLEARSRSLSPRLPCSCA